MTEREPLALILVLGAVFCFLIAVLIGTDIIVSSRYLAWLAGGLLSLTLAILLYGAWGWRGSRHV